MTLLDLPNDILRMLGDACESQSDLSALSRTNSSLYTILNRHLYRDALRENDGLIFIEALRGKKDDLVLRLAQESNTIRGFTWSNFSSIWYDGVPIRGTVRFLVAREQNIDIHAPGPFNGQQMLKSMIEESDAAGIDMLMEWKGPELLSEPEATQLPFVYYAASLGDTRIIWTLARHGFPIDFRGEQDRTPLMIAAINGHVMAVKLLLEKNASVHLKDKHHKLTALGWAVRRGRTLMSIRLLIIHGSDPNIRDKNDRHLILTPLHMAFKSAVMPLLWGGARFVDEDAHIPHFLFDFACVYGLDDVARWVYRRYPERVKTNNGGLPWYFLLHAVHGMSVKVVKQLLEWGADPNQRGLWDETPLNAALLDEDERALLIVKDLLGHGADVNAADKLGSPLHLALRFNKKRAAFYGKLLLDYGLNLRYHRRAIGTELLHLAIYANDLDMVWALDAQGVSLNIAFGIHPLPLIQAMSYGYVPIVNYLLRRGARYDVVNHRGQTTLTWAITNGHVETVKILLSMVHLENYKDEIETGLVLALFRGDDRVNQAIVDAGLDLPEDLIGVQNLFGSV